MTDQLQKPLRVALVQMTCVWGDIPANLRKIEDFASQATEAKADWVLFPELTIQGIYKSPAVFQLSEPVDGPCVSRVCDEQMWPEFNPRIPSLAGDNRIWALVINQAGQPHPSMKFVGPTFAAGPDGRLAALSSGEAEQLLTVEIPAEAE